MRCRESTSDVIKGQMLALHEKGLSNRKVAPQAPDQGEFREIRSQQVSEDEFHD